MIHLTKHKTSQLSSTTFSMEDNEEHHHHQQHHHQQPSTPFWIQNTTFQSSGKRSFATFSSIIFSSVTVILLLTVAAALIFIFFIIPSILNFTSEIFKPNSVKRSWDSLNLVLILFAIICPFLSRNNDSNETPKSASSSRFRSSSYKYRESEQGYDIDMYSYSDRMMTRLRSSSSYPDLRHQVDYTTSPISPWISADYIDRSNRVGNVAYRFSDDTQLRSYQFTDSNWQIGVKPSIETVVEDPKPEPNPVSSSSLTPPEQLPQLPFNPVLETPTTTKVKLKSNRTFRAVERNEEVSKESNATELIIPPGSPTRAATVRRKTKRVNRSFDDAAFEIRDEEQQQTHTAESDLTERKKSGGATKEFLSSFYGNQKRKKKRERQRSSENFEQLLKRPIVPLSSTTITQPPPPPPPPPPSVFQNIFSTKKSKGKKTASDPSDSITSKSRFTKPNTTTTKIALAQPPIQTSTTKSNSYNISKGNESPLYGIPEPPPLPPFGMPVWKFVVEGDYVRLKSMNSSRSGSPDPEDNSARASSVNEDSMRSEIDYDNDGGSSPAPSPVPGTTAFCPSPDVNTKADNFIARFRAGLKMEKVNSGKGVGLSKLGPVVDINNHN